MKTKFVPVCSVTFAGSGDGVLRALLGEIGDLVDRKQILGAVVEQHERYLPDSVRIGKAGADQEDVLLLGRRIRIGRAHVELQVGVTCGFAQNVTLWITGGWPKIRGSQGCRFGRTAPLLVCPIEPSPVESMPVTR